MHQTALLYVPVIHKGYLDFIDALTKDTVVSILDTSVLQIIDKHFDYLRKEIRALTPLNAITSLQALYPGRTFKMFSALKLEELSAKTNVTLFLPKEDIFVWLQDQYFANHSVTFIPTFLRWDRKNTLVNLEISAKQTELPQQILDALTLAKSESEKSSDWWRQVGCVVVKDNKVVAIGHNTHLPTPYTPYVDGDARNAFHKGEHIDLSTAIHAEASVIAECAKKGISLAGSTMVATTFPCPTCSKLVAAAGVKKLYFSDGYAVLDGEKVLMDAEIVIQKIK